jgi:Domain of unknown function (DUF4783)
MTTHSKKILLLLVAPLLVMAVALSDLESIAAAIRSGNAKGLAVHFDSMVELKAGDKEGTFSKAQSEQIMKDFFGQYPPKSFTFVHDGPSTGNNSSYAIGKYVSGNKQFRTSVYLRKKGDKMFIQELSFENE